MQRETSQYDHLARVPRTGPRQSRGRRSSAPRHWCRTAPRRSRGMERAVRTPRIESAIGFSSCSKARFSADDSRASAGLFPSEISRRERNFWMQRLEAKKSTRETVMPAETGNLKTVDENPRRNGLFSIDDGLRGSGRLDGGDNLDQTACSPLSQSNRSLNSIGFLGCVSVSLVL